MGRDTEARQAKNLYSKKLSISEEKCTDLSKNFKFLGKYTFKNGCQFTKIYPLKWTRYGWIFERRVQPRKESNWYSILIDK